MTRHIVSQDIITRFGSAEAFFRHVAKTKPPTKVPCKPCLICGADHRGPPQFWPEAERTLHEKMERHA